MQPHSPTPRPGFTLVELLMVIVIIGILAGLLIVAVGPAIGTAKTAVVKTEINQLDVALNNYRDTYGSLPPTMFTKDGAYATSGTAENEKEVTKLKRFDRHMRKSFPRFRLSGDYNGDSSTDENDIREEYTDLLSTATDFSGVANYGGVTSCDLSTMDPAEALVFWLGGIPKIWKADLSTGEYEVELTGFSKNPTDPLLQEYPPTGGGTAGVDYQSERTPTLFEFDTRRLVDVDRDGWPEYIPDTGAGLDTPPLTYFDAGSYGVAPYFPYDSHPNINQWGITRPYLIRYTSAAADDPLQSSFANSESFQILCAGSDNVYSALTASDSSTTFGDTNNDLTLTATEIDQLVLLLPVYPEGLFYSLNSDPRTTGSIDAPQFDNLTNFAESKLENDFNSGN